MYNGGSATYARGPNGLCRVPPTLKNEAYGFENGILYFHMRTFV